MCTLRVRSKYDIALYIEGILRWQAPRWRYEGLSNYATLILTCANTRLILTYVIFNSDFSLFEFVL